MPILGATLFMSVDSSGGPCRTPTSAIRSVKLLPPRKFAPTNIPSRSVGMGNASQRNPHVTVRLGRTFQSSLMKKPQFVKRGRKSKPRASPVAGSKPMLPCENGSSRAKSQRLLKP